MGVPAATIEHLLQAPEAMSVYLTPGERKGDWRRYFGECAHRLPAPFWLYDEDERNTVTLGYPVKVSTAWEAWGRDLQRLLETELRYRLATFQGKPFEKPQLTTQRAAMVAALTPLFVNVFEHDFGRGFPELFWLALSREVAVRFQELPGELVSWAPELSRADISRFCYQVAERMAELCERAEQQAFRQIRSEAPWVSVEEGRKLGQLIRGDLLPLVALRPSATGQELDFYLSGKLGLDPLQFRKILRERVEALDILRQKDASFTAAAALVCPEAPSLPTSAWLFQPSILRLLALWRHPATPRMSAELLSLLESLSGCLRRFEVIAALRARLLPIAWQGSRPVTRAAGQMVGLSSSTRAFDFTTPGVVPSAVRRYGLVYDLVEFSAIVEEIHRRGQKAEMAALRFLLRFHYQWEELRSQHRLHLEKFLGDGAFYSARSARGAFIAAVRARLAYEELRQQGCPFDRGLRMALNVSTYHLFPLLGGKRARFEFFGRGLVELSRLTTGKATQEVEDITEFLVARGYDLHKVLDFLEPVRSGGRMPEDMAQRPYGAYLLENGELQNLGTVLTEAFLREMELEWSDLRVGQAQVWGMPWLVVMLDPTNPDGPWAGLRYLGVARLKGLEPLPLYELVSWETAPPGLSMLPPGTSLVSTLRSLAQVEGDRYFVGVPAEPDPRLCVASALEEEGRRAWYLGLWQEDTDALHNAFRVPLVPAERAQDEPIEAWLFRQRAELAKLYQALRRKSSGATLPLDGLRHRDGYIACLLTAPHRSPR